MKAPEVIVSSRLLYRRPGVADAGEIFSRYASDPDVTRYLSWRVHVSLAQTRAFVAFSDDEWRKWPAGPYLAFGRDDGRLLGGTGLAFEALDRAATGYVFAKDCWGRGFATEALNAMVDLARSADLRRLYALCHLENLGSVRVLEKCGFSCEGTRPQFVEFPNLASGARADVLCYARLP
ncbi:MAG TPA: GNAT family N-acetyltransferase [Bacteroidota bacterium]|nr:GNAT family N-acetyltransferase [Bacteroidota bacterium]